MNALRFFAPIVLSSLVYAGMLVWNYLDSRRRIRVLREALDRALEMNKECHQLIWAQQREIDRLRSVQNVMVLH